MAVDDVVSGIGTSGAITDYQPAAGVETVITQVIQSESVAISHFYDGTNTGEPFVTSNTALTSSISGSMKLFVTNTLYLRMDAQTAKFNTYCGVQIK